jgi:uncharacterized protein
VRAQEKMTAKLVGVISDTHGLLRPEAVATLQGSDYIIHAGDVGDPAILKRLKEIAPVTAVRGNVDRGSWAKKILETNVLEINGLSIYVLHDLNQLDLNPEAAGFSAVVSGHSHMPKQETKNGVLYFNPGSAGPKRFKLPVTVGRIRIQDGKLHGEILQIQ